MSYEYRLENLPKEETVNMLGKSKEIRRVIDNTNYYLVTIGVAIMLLISFTLNKFTWDNRNLILIGGYLIGILIIRFRKRVNVKTYYNQIQKRIKSNQTIVKDNKIYKYTRGNLSIVLSQNTVGEFVQSENYTLVLAIPKRLKSIVVVPIIIPNNLFGSEEKYNEFINAISK